MNTQHSDKKSQETNSSTHNVTIGPPFTLPANEAWSDQIVQKTFPTSGGAMRTTRIRIVRTAATTPSNIPTALHEETVSPTFPHQPANEFPGNLFFMDATSGQLFMVSSRRPPVESRSGGKVFQVIDADGKQWAIKVPKPSADHFQIAKEVDFLHRVKGKTNIVEFQGAVEDIRGDCLLFDTGGPGNLQTMFDNRGALLAPEINFFARQLLEGLGNIHDEGIIHCNLSPENILLGPKMKVLICGFGSAEERNKHSNTRKGTKGFIAPEILEDKTHSTAVDIFSAGCIILNMIIGEAPDLTNDTMANRPSKDYFLEVTTSDLARIFLQRALELNPDERASLEELSRHAFLRSVYCPKEIPESAFFTPPTFHNDSKRQQEEHSAEEDEHVNKKVMTQSSTEATGNSEQAQRKEAMRGYSKRDEQCDITIEIESLRAKKQQAEEEVNVAVMKLIEVEAKLAVKEKQQQEKCKDLVSF